MMAQRALPNPYADYDKSLGTAYFDASGRVSRDAGGPEVPPAPLG